jgi:hypothetical protein
VTLEPVGKPVHFPRWPVEIAPAIAEPEGAGTRRGARPAGAGDREPAGAQADFLMTAAQHRAQAELLRKAGNHELAQQHGNVAKSTGRKRRSETDCCVLRVTRKTALAAFASGNWLFRPLSSHVAASVRPWATIVIRPTRPIPEAPLRALEARADTSPLPALRQIEALRRKFYPSGFLAVLYDNVGGHRVGLRPTEPPKGN